MAPDKSFHVNFGEMAIIKSFHRAKCGKIAGVMLIYAPKTCEMIGFTKLDRGEMRFGKITLFSVISPILNPVLTFFAIESGADSSSICRFEMLTPF